MGFLKGVLRVSLIAALTVIIVSVAGWKIYEWSEAREAAKLGELQAFKGSIQAVPSFFADDQAVVNVSIPVKVMWRDGKLYYRFMVRGIPKASEGEATIVLAFTDANDFNVVELPRIRASDMVKSRNDKAVTVALSTENSIAMSAENYRLIRGVHTAWTGAWVRSAPDDGYLYNVEGEHVEKGTPQSNPG